MVALFCLASLVSFFYKGIIAPINHIINIQDEDVRVGDFWATFPAPFVDRYNPALRDETVAKRYFMGEQWAYGPIQHLITLPLTFLKSIKVISVIWFIVNHIFLVAAILLILKLLGDIPNMPKILIVALWFGFWPLYIAIQEYTIEIFELFLIILSLYLLCKDKEGMTGITLGIATMAKFLPGIFLPYFLIKKQFKAFFAMLITILLIAAVAQPLLGWQNNETVNNFLTETKESQRSIYTYWRSQTVPALINRIFSRTDYSVDHIYIPKIVYPMPAKWLSRIAGLSILLLAFFLLYRKRRERSGNIAMEYSIMSILMYLVAPHGQPYYLIFNLIGYSFALKYIYESRYTFGWIVLLISYAISGLVNQIWWFDNLLLYNTSRIDRHTFFYFLSFPTYGTILFFLLLLHIYRHSESMPHFKS